MNIITRSLLLTHVARRLLEAPGTVTFDELFDGFQGPESGKSVSTSWKKAVMGFLVDKRWVSKRGTAGREAYQLESATDIAKLYRDGEAEEAEVKKQRYFARREESIGKGHVLLRAIKKLLASGKPLARGSLFTPKRGDKFQERASMIPTWQNEMLKKLLEDGMIRQDGNGPPKYSAEDREALEKLLDGCHHPCVFSMVDPSEPCGVDHEAAKRQKSLMDAVVDNISEVTGSDPPEGPTPSVPSSVPSESDEGVAKVLAQVIRTLESQASVFDSIRKESGLMNEGFDLLVKSVDLLGRRLESTGAGIESSQDKIRSAAESMSTDSGSVKELLSELLPVLAEAVSQIRNARKEDQARFEKTVGLFQTAVEELKKDHRREDDGRARINAFTARLEAVATSVDAWRDRARKILEVVEA